MHEPAGKKCVVGGRKKSQRKQAAEKTCSHPGEDSNAGGRLLLQEVASVEFLEKAVLHGEEKRAGVFSLGEGGPAQNPGIRPPELVTGIQNGLGR